jgi:glyoxylase-like metal-dependent hydrolase (beta-lactamase superfamily II)
MKKIIFIILICLSLPTLAWDLGKVGNFKFEKVNQNVYVMHGPLGEPNKANQGFMNNPSIILSKNGLILIDPGSTYQVGKNILNEIKKITDKPILAVINTHVHGDHWLANHAIKEAYPKIKIYAHPTMIKRAKESVGNAWLKSMLKMTEGLSKDTKLVIPNTTLENQTKITVDGENFLIHTILPAHTNTDIMIEHTESKTLFLGDNCFSKRFGMFDDSSSIHGNIQALELIEKLDINTFVPGHGKSGNLIEVLTPFLDYLIKLKKHVQIGYDKQLEDFNIKKNIINDFSDYKDWIGFDTNFGKHVNKMYLEIEEINF